MWCEETIPRRKLAISHVIFSISTGGLAQEEERLLFQRPPNLIGTALNGKYVRPQNASLEDEAQSKSLKVVPLMASARTSYLGVGISDDSDQDQGYDSEVAELSRGATLARAAKRRRRSDPGDERGENIEQDESADSDPLEAQDDESDQDQILEQQSNLSTILPQVSSTTKRPTSKTTPGHNAKEQKPGVIYLSSLPPYLRPSALRNLLTQRGFSPITRLFLTPASKASSHHSKKNSRQLYTEGWIEFGSKKVARRCAEGLNATPVGGKKGGFYRDDVWNMKYLRGMRWDELMAGVREERREEEGRRDEERRIIVGEAKRFVEGVEKGRQEEGMRRKKKRKNPGADGRDAPEDVKRTWRQFEVMGAEQDGKQKSKKRKEDNVNEDVQAVLGKIF